ncbi:hypothetical protein V2A60_009842 [Cordyceps javanica]
MALAAAAAQSSPLAGRQSELAVIFARGTFDSGNIGPWVGQPFRDALYSKFGAGRVALQGVDPRDYLADLDGYIEDGGPESCAVSLGKAVERYSARCPLAKIVISGWSQGALCAHKSLDPSNALVDEHARSRVIALTTFGDPVSAWSDSISFPALPENARLLSYCETGIPDPLCTNPLEDWPHSPKAFIDKLQAIWHDFGDADLNSAQKAAIHDLVAQLVSQARSKIGKLGGDIFSGHIRHWILTPQHFLYGVGLHPMTKQAAADIARIFQQSK